MVFEKVNEKDPMGPLVVVLVYPKGTWTGHGENLENKWKDYRRPRHVPKCGHTRKDLLQLGLRAEGRSNIRHEAEPFVPGILVSDNQAFVLAKPPVKRPRGSTLFERYLTGRGK